MNLRCTRWSGTNAERRRWKHGLITQRACLVAEGFGRKPFSPGWTERWTVGAMTKTKVALQERDQRLCGCEKGSGWYDTHPDRVSLIRYYCIVVGLFILPLLAHLRLFFFEWPIWGCWSLEEANTYWRRYPKFQTIIVLSDHLQKILAHALRVSVLGNAYRRWESKVLLLCIWF